MGQANSLPSGRRSSRVDTLHVHAYPALGTVVQLAELEQLSVQAVAFLFREGSPLARLG